MNRVSRIGLPVAAVAALALLPLWMNSGYSLHMFITVGLFIVMSLGFDILNGRLGLLFLAPAAFFGVGSYSVALLQLHLGITMFFPLSLVVGGAVAALGALLLSFPLLRLNSHIFATATLALAVVMELIAVNWVEVTRGPMCVAGLDGPTLNLAGGGPFITAPVGYYYLMLGLVLIAIVAYRAIVSSRVGRAMSAICQSESLASAQGIPVARYKRLGLTIGAFSFGVGGAFAAQYARVTCPDDLTLTYVTLNLLVIAFIGGTRSIPGMTIGAAAVVMLPELFRFSPEARMVLYGAILLVIALFAPRGIVDPVKDAYRKLRGRITQKEKS